MNMLARIHEKTSDFLSAAHDPQRKLETDLLEENDSRILLDARRRSHLAKGALLLMPLRALRLAARWLATKLADISQAVPTMDPNEVSFGRFRLDLNQSQLVPQPRTLSGGGQSPVKAKHSHEITREMAR
jgi:hypothetical protein